MENQSEQEARLRRVGRSLSYTGAIMKIYKDDMEMPDGRVVQWDYFQHNGGAAVIPVLEDGRILMVRQYRNALDRYTLEIPAGAFDFEGEQGISCASRELEEETGYRSESFSFLLNMNSMPAFTNEKVSIYVAEHLEKTMQHLDEQEFLNVEAWELEALIAKIYEGTLTDSKTVCALLAYQLKRIKEQD
ncbi:MAG: NUDIX hydrolase [Lachnospiraceae bacterium]|nr:NUDIX hydrolase [Lachnospiraceae bacterium]